MGDDVYILGDIDSAAFRPEELKQLADVVSNGAGLVMLGGFHSFGPGGYDRTALAKVLRDMVEGAPDSDRHILARAAAAGARQRQPARCISADGSARRPVTWLPAVTAEPGWCVLRIWTHLVNSLARPMISSALSKNSVLNGMTWF